MAETQIDSLVIEIGTKSSSAASDIDMVTAALTRLKGVGSFTKVVNNLTKLGTALERISVSSSGIQTLYKVSSAIENLSKTSKGNSISSVVNSLKKIPDVTNKLDDATINKFASAVNKISSAITPLTNKINSLSSGFSRLPSRITSCVTAANKYQKSMQSASSVSGSFFGKIKSFLGIGGLYALSFKAISNKVGNAISNMNDYIENVNLFTVSMGEYADKSMDYAEKVQDAMGIDMSEFIRNQGIFMNMATGFGIANDKAYQLSKGLTELAYDISSFYNVDVETAFQRLQSGIAGEIEPVRRWGIALDQASMQEWLLKKGIDAKVNSLNQADKAMIRYNMMVEAMAGNGAIGDFARTLITPANAIRILNQQITQLSRAIGALFIPILIKVIPYVQAFVKVLTGLIQTVAKFFGFSMPQIDYSGINGLSVGASEASDSLDDAAKSAKKLKNYTAGFDELNIIPSNNSSSAGSGVSTGTGSLGLDPSTVWDDSIMNGIDSQVEQLTGKMKVVLGIATAIGTVFLLWKIGNAIFAGIKTVTELLKTAEFTVGLLMGKMMLPINPAQTGVLKWLSKFGQYIAPALAVAAAIATITVVIVDLWKNSESFRDAWSNVCEKISGAFKRAKDTIWNYGIKPLLDALGLTATSFGEFYAKYVRPVLEAIGVLFLNIFGGIISTALDLFSQNFIFVTGIVKGLLTGDWSQALTGLKGIWNTVFNALPEPVQKMVSGVIGFFSNLFSKVSNFATGIKDNVVNAFKRMRDLCASAVNGLKNLIASPINGIIGGFEKLANGVIDAVNAMVRGLNKLSFKIPSWVPALGGKKFSLNLSTISKISIPRFERGGFLEDGLFTMNRGEIAGKFSNGKSVVANNMQIIKGINSGVSDGIRQAIGGDLRNIAKALSSTSYIDYSSMDANPSAGSFGDSMQLEDFVSRMMVQNNQGGDYTFVVNLDGEVVAKKVFKVHNKIAMQTGETPLLI